jgi:hypothetical protein
MCSECGSTIEVLDTKLHGYDAECDKASGVSYDAHYRGNGPRTAIPCSNCGLTEFVAKATFGHSHFDLMQDIPELEPLAHDYFDAFTCRGTCCKCEKESILVSFELA